MKLLSTPWRPCILHSIKSHGLIRLRCQMFSQTDGTLCGSPFLCQGTCPRTGIETLDTCGSQWRGHTMPLKSLQRSINSVATRLLCLKGVLSLKARSPHSSSQILGEVLIISGQKLKYLEKAYLCRFRRLRVALRTPWRVPKEGHPFRCVCNSQQTLETCPTHEMEDKSSKRQLLPTCSMVQHRGLCEMCLESQ